MSALRTSPDRGPTNLQMFSDYQWIEIEEDKHIEHHFAGVTSQHASQRPAGSEKVWDAFRRTEFLRLDPEALRAPAKHAASGQRLATNGAGLGAVLADITLDDPSRRELIGDYLSRIVPATRGVSLVRADRFSDTHYEVVVTFDHVGKVSAERLSEGTLFALGLITVLTSTIKPSHLLIDDLDKGLHPNAQTELVGVLRKFIDDDPELQVICTSHSPYLLDSFSTGEVRVMTLGDKGHALCRPLVEHPKFAKWEGALAAGEMWASVGENWIREAKNAS